MSDRVGNIAVTMTLNARDFHGEVGKVERDLERMRENVVRLANADAGLKGDKRMGFDQLRRNIMLDSKIDEWGNEGHMAAAQASREDMARGVSRESMGYFETSRAAIERATASTMSWHVGLGGVAKAAGTVAGAIEAGNVAVDIFDGNLESAQARIKDLPFGIGRVTTSAIDLIGKVSGMAAATDANTAAAERLNSVYQIMRDTATQIRDIRKETKDLDARNVEQGAKIRAKGTADEPWLDVTGAKEAEMRRLDDQGAAEKDKLRKRMAELNKVRADAQKQADKDRGALDTWNSRKWMVAGEDLKAFRTERLESAATTSGDALRQADYQASQLQKKIEDVDRETAKRKASYLDEVYGPAVTAQIDAEQKAKRDADAKEARAITERGDKQREEDAKTLEEKRRGQEKLDAEARRASEAEAKAKEDAENRGRRIGGQVRVGYDVGATGGGAMGNRPIPTVGDPVHTRILERIARAMEGKWIARAA
jgi:hypothetical protein